MIKEIEKYPGYYVDDTGKVYSNKLGSLREIKQRPKTHGYLYVTLSVNNKRYFPRVHRLIAEVFIPNPNNLPEVNHKDENKTNNRVDNLEWCTSHDNKVYGSRLEKVARKVIDPNIPRANNKSGRKGVFETKYHTWKVYFRRKHLGTYKTFDEAVKVRETAEREYMDGYKRSYNS